MRWTCGVTTVPQRKDHPLPQTLTSLVAAGFNFCNPRLFMDGERFVPFYDNNNGAVSSRFPTIGAWGNWILALWELYLRDPLADRFAIFQDDIVLCRNLREYLDRCRYPEKGWWNLFTFRDNERLTGAGMPLGWAESVLRNGNTTMQVGRGALALVFNREAVATLLCQPGIVVHSQTGAGGTRCIDGTVCEAMNIAGWREFVHNPSLVQHVGERSTVSDKTHTVKAESFRGEHFDCTELIKNSGGSHAG